MNNEASYTVPGLELEDGHKVAAALQARLHALNDLQLTLKHAHWNVVGRDFIGVHEMLDPQIDVVRAAVDMTAERMATLGGAPVGTPGALVKDRSWDDYELGRATCEEHLAALNLVYEGVIADHREVIEMVGEIDPVTEDMLIGQTAALEQFQWFVRAHLENSSGDLDTQGASTEKGAAKKAVAASNRSRRKK
ncbi:MAG: DNA starvation/stationary phase protection protein [Propionibacteriales bacterium]|nr:DNA starvation/stationary phase protection protein [Propionibacteriales bacterium]